MTQETLNTQQKTEKALIGALLLDDRVTERVRLASSTLEPGDFADEQSRYVWASLVNLASQDQPICLSEVERVSGYSRTDLSECFALSSTIYEIDEGLRLVKRNSLLRQIAKLANQIGKTASEGQAESTTSNLKNLRAQLEALDTEPLQGKLKSMEEVAQEWFDYKQEALDNHGLSLGFRAFDDQDLSLKPGHLVIIGARPKMGKTTFGVQVALNTAQTKNVVFFSLEMSSVEITDKLLAYSGEIPPSITQNWGRDKYQVAMTKYGDRFNQAFNELPKLKMTIFDQNVTIWAIESALKKFRETNPLDLVVIDQLSFIATDGKFDRQGKHIEYDYIVSNLKRIARELAVPVVLMVQLNREIEKRAEKVPQLSDLKDSGRIEESADLIILLHKDEQKQVGGFHITNRHGSGCKIDLKWDDHLAKFTNLKLPNYAQ